MPYALSLLAVLLSQSIERPDVPLPLQPFTVELLDLKRGEWQFPDALGQWLALPGPAVAWAFPGKAEGPVRLAYLCCDPEFPDDLRHAALRIVEPERTGVEPPRFRIEEPYFSADMTAGPVRDGSVRCEFSNIGLGPATTGDRYVAGMYLLIGKQACPLWLAPDASDTGLSPRLLTDRVGNVFTEGEPVALTLAAAWAGGPSERTFEVRVSEKLNGETVWSGQVSVARERGVSVSQVRVPLTRYGVFEVEAEAEGVPSAKLRVCRLPRPRRIDPDRSAMGINLFQQQIWWYAYQAPLMQKAGVHWIRPWLAWENTWAVQEPAPGQWDTRALDAALRRMERFDQRYQLILFSSPSWLTGSGNWQAPRVDQMDAWGAYIEKLVTRYRGRIRHWEVWNEPDLMWPEATRLQGDHYFAMLKVTYAAAKRADPGCVILGLSSAGVEDWMSKLGAMGAADYFDIATVHSYAPPGDFARNIERRRALLEGDRPGRKPVWVNELGTTAYDFSPAYSAKYQCSEHAQAWHLPALYASALAVDPTMKAFWFCTYDPRDAAHESQWTGDAGIGVLYQGFLPKLSYAALAATAYEIDGRRCLGRVDLSREVHQISFDGPVAVVWHDRPAGAEPLPASALGCLPDERITVKDMLANPIASGRAADLTVDLSRGTVFVEGSRQMAAQARCEAAFSVSPRELSVAPGSTQSVRVAVPTGVAVVAEPSVGLPVAARVAPPTALLSLDEGIGRASGSIRMSARFPVGQLGLADAYEAVRWLFVTTGVPNLIRDGGFTMGDLADWSFERTSAYAYDPEVGRGAPGSMRLDGPFDRRLVHWNIAPTPGRETRLRCWVKTDRLQGCLLTLNVANFAPERWLNAWCLAASTPATGAPDNPPAAGLLGRIPSGDSDWALVEAVLPGDAIPAETRQMAFFVDVKGGDGALWIDDIDLWQP